MSQGDLLGVSCSTDTVLPGETWSHVNSAAVPHMQDQRQSFGVKRLCDGLTVPGRACIGPSSSSQHSWQSFTEPMCTQSDLSSCCVALMRAGVVMLQQ